MCRTPATRRSNLDILADIGRCIKFGGQEPGTLSRRPRAPYCRAVPNQNLFYLLAR